jgi:hypothetical protein
MAHFDEAPMEVDSVHGGHVDIGDQASGFDKARGSEEIGSRWESLNAIAQ